MPLPDPRAYFSDEEIDRARRYHRPGYVRAVAGAVVSLGYLAVLAFTGLGDAVADRMGSAAAFVAVIVVAGSLLGLPLRAWGFAHERRWGFATQSWLGWLNDWAKGAIVGLVVTGGLLLGFLTLAHAPPHAWVWVAAPLAAAVVFVLSFLAPVVFEPLFNRFRPLEDEALAASVRALSRDAGVPVRDVLVADASRRTTKENAYVSGLGATRRIVVYDTLLRTGSDRQVRLVVAHELGHAKRHDVLRQTLLGALGVSAASCAAYLVLSWPPLLHRAGVAAAGDGRSVALLLFLGLAAGMVCQPAPLLLSRRVEATADVHSLDLTRDPAGFVEMERTLAVTNIADLDPHPVRYALFASHPTAPRRIALARDWARLHGVPEPAAGASR